VELVDEEVPLASIEGQRPKIRRIRKGIV